MRPRRAASSTGLIVGLIVGGSVLLIGGFVLVLLLVAKGGGERDEGPARRVDPEMEAKVARDIHDIDLAVMTYYVECGFREFPADLPVLVDPTNKTGRVLLKHTLDPWGRRYHYDINGMQNALHGERKPDIWCVLPGADGWVIGNWASGKVRMGG